MLRVLVGCEFSGTVRDAFTARGHYARSCDLLPTESRAAVRFAGDCPPCECCGDEPWCVVHEMHYADCTCVGPTEDEAEYDEASYASGGDLLGARHHSGSIFDIDIEREGYDMLIACPPCTRLTNSGVRWLHVPPPGKTLKQIWKELDEGAAFYRRVRDLPIRMKAIENPVMHKYARERIQPGPRQVVQPWWFGEPQFKATGFELIGLPPLVPTRKLTPPKPGTPEHKRWSKVHLASPGPNRWKERSTFFPGLADAMAEQWGSIVPMERAA